MDVAMIGAGMIGRAWSISFARAGHDVRLWSKTPGRAQEAIGFVSSILPDLAANGLLRDQAPAAVLARITAVDELGAAVAGAGWVQENALEQVAIKRDIYERIDELAPRDAVIASSTSGIRPSEFTEGLPGRARCIVAHPLNPPYLVPAVDVVPSPWTTPETVERAVQVLTDIGQSPIVMSREDDAFVTIRLQGAILQEAFRLVDEGIASPEDVDRTIRDGLALRWSFIGPFETIDLNAPNGVRDFVGRFGESYAKMAREHGQLVDWFGPTLDVVEQHRRATLPMDDHRARQAWRDRRLMALVAHRRAIEDTLGR